MAQQKAAAKKSKRPTEKKPVVAAKKPVLKTSAKSPAPKAAPAKVVAGKMKAGAEKTPAGKVEKPAKVSSGLSKADLQYFRNLLLEKRREILGDVGSMESEAFKQGSNLSNMPIHMADVGTDNFEQEFTLGLIESERQILREIQDALVRIDDGTYGVCQAMGKPIGRVRLEAVPWAKHCMEYQKALESGQIRQEEGGAADDDGGDEEEE